jgi:hypothetical protein
VNAVETLYVAAWKLDNPSNDDSSILIMLANASLGEPLAAWLRESAERLATSLPHWSHKFPEGWEGDTPRPKGQPRTGEELAAIVEHHYGRALAVARSILGEQP